MRILQGIDYACVAFILDVAVFDYLDISLLLYERGLEACGGGNDFVKAVCFGGWYAFVWVAVVIRGG
ncbi:hypothetical protein [Helicobacter saguini]|uniref:Uncharacterized protein n=1 Tax=Helicobacter saguini TaxID=1548018 RepID=A0A6L7DCV8_9HELI|nr:hypothetical protein [Helicobacter saguini]MWV69699.1 hypothetical protein [Helicobacter saguini]